MSTTQCTFKIVDLLKLIGNHTTGNVLITETKTPTGVSYKAQLTPSASASGAMAAIDSPSDGSGDGSIDGCPFPPGCTN